MNAKKEKTYLDCVLKQMEPGFSCAYCGPVARVIVFLTLVGVIFGVSEYRDQLPFVAMVGLPMLAGFAYGFVTVMKLAQDNWPYLLPHVSRESIEKRLAEIEAEK